ncbi:MAG: hypothetical protein HY556_01290 [Euryarchaeota archaeon]|nr:hypothetical protein [Euryarchaeota archaeon]
MEPNDEDLARLKEVKVKIPINYHIKLHSMKVLTGKQISDTITEALDRYFHELKGPSALEAPDPAAISQLRSGIEEP